MLLPSFKIYVADSKIARGGRGVFAFADIEKGEIIERSPVMMVGGKEVLLGFGSLYQHSPEPNAACEKFADDDLVKFVAVKDIIKNEEITLKSQP